MAWRDSVSTDEQSLDDPLIYVGPEMAESLGLSDDTNKPFYYQEEAIERLAEWYGGDAPTTVL